MSEIVSNNVVFIQDMLDARKSENKFAKTQALMASISIWSTGDSNCPIDISVIATEADRQYNLASLFEPEHASQPRLLALASGLESLASEIRKLHNNLAPSE